MLLFNLYPWQLSRPHGASKIRLTELPLEDADTDDLSILYVIERYVLCAGESRYQHFLVCTNTNANSHLDDAAWIVPVGTQVCVLLCE